MAISYKSKAEIELMREAGRILAITHDELAKQVKPGMTTLEVDRIGEELIRSYGFAEDDEYIRVNMQWLWRNVGISYPAYYLSYGTSAMASLSLYNMSQEDYDVALEAYRILVEEADENKNFTGTLEKAGIDSIFEEAAYIKLRATCKD